MRRVLIAFIFIGLFAGVADAQITSGDDEFSFAAYYYKFSGDLIDDDFIYLYGRWGHAFTDHHMLGLGLMAAASDIGDLFDDENTMGEVFYIYHFTPEKEFTWYAKGDYLFIFDDADAGNVDLSFGFKNFFTEHAAVFWEVGYGFSVDDDLNDDIFRSATGITVVF
jgi:hypothetical protein